MVRKAQISDLTALFKLYNTLFQLMEKMEPNYMKTPEEEELFLISVLTEENNLIAFVYEEHENILGFVIANLRDSPEYSNYIPQKAVYLVDIVVDENSRDQGIGKALIDRVKEWGTENAVDYFELTVLSANQAAIRLYEREGLIPFSVNMRMKMK
ncbi:GNAT family N-acetyltransferase [Sphingobacterium sp. UT-1RO-CII-1]|uniref:GNAT family N-acetyltransferase n=1 Tax=Sphingobacterium sp. UT-1RO-CII-1 TaxID=2995225 RepID=UPI00227A9C4A|nr:GNAT family N-acetyltransferase [Sphingobacterium sp. UT-1RO-CII-1]MCY4778070.1 GNAT family N-acetyltransferase [Sphingobacterium sp. UT-1RO-CII-1]